VGDAYRALDPEAPPDTAIILCPNHTGMGSRISIWSEGSWETPLGDIAVDETIASSLLARLGEKGDREAHLREHAIEVHLPFLKVLSRAIRIVPITLGRLSYDDCRRVGDALEGVVRDTKGGRILIVASTDMSHYISAEEARKKDWLALRAIEHRNSKELFEIVTSQQISMCGFIPTTCAMEASVALGAESAWVISYGHSGEVTGETDSVVGYAAVVIE
jgi:MEMO1 family protein